MVFKTTFEQFQRWSLSRRHWVQKTQRNNDWNFLNMLFKGELVLILVGLNSGILLYIKCHFYIFFPINSLYWNLTLTVFITGIKCPVCSKFIQPNDIECHLVVCLTKPRITYNGKSQFRTDTTQWSASTWKKWLSCLPSKAKNYNVLTLKAPRDILEQMTIYFYFLFFKENNAWHFIWIVCKADDSHVMSSTISSEKYE